MADMLVDYTGKAWFALPNGHRSKSGIIKEDEIVNFGEWVEEEDSEYLPFDVADAKDLSGVSFSTKTKGDASGTNKDRVEIKSKFDLLRVYLTGIAITSTDKVVWVKSSEPGCNATAEKGCTLTYATGAKIGGYVSKYVTTNYGNVFVQPKKLVRKTKFIQIMGGIDTFPVPAAGAFFGIMDFDVDIIIRGFAYNPSVLEQAGQGYDVKAWADGSVLTGTLQVRNADIINTEKEQAITDAAGTFLAAGDEFKFEVDAHEGAAPDTGMAAFSLIYDEVPKFN